VQREISPELPSEKRTSGEGLVESACAGERERVSARTRPEKIIFFTDYILSRTRLKEGWAHPALQKLYSLG